MSCIDAHYQRSVAQLSEFDPCGSGEARLPHAALTCE